MSFVLAWAAVRLRGRDGRIYRKNTAIDRGVPADFLSAGYEKLHPSPFILFFPIGPIGANLYLISDSRRLHKWKFPPDRRGGALHGALRNGPDRGGADPDLMQPPDGRTATRRAPRGTNDTPTLHFKLIAGDSARKKIEKMAEIPPDHQITSLRLLERRRPNGMTAFPFQPADSSTQPASRPRD